MKFVWTLAFYADAVVDTPLKAANVLLDLLRAEADWSVLNSADRRGEPFDRRKLMDSIRAACRGAECDDIVGPGLILPAVIERLKNSEQRLKNQFPTDEIDKAVLAALKESSLTREAQKGRGSRFRCGCSSTPTRKGSVPKSSKS